VRWWRCRRITAAGSCASQATITARRRTDLVRHRSPPPTILCAFQRGQDLRRQCQGKAQTNKRFPTRAQPRSGAKGMISAPRKQEDAISRASAWWAPPAYERCVSKGRKDTNGQVGAAPWPQGGVLARQQPNSPQSHCCQGRAGHTRPRGTRIGRPSRRPHAQLPHSGPRGRARRAGTPPHDSSSCQIIPPTRPGNPQRTAGLLTLLAVRDGGWALGEAQVGVLRADGAVPEATDTVALPRDWQQTLARRHTQQQPQKQTHLATTEWGAVWAWNGLLGALLPALRGR
jgi:hypothetical protein